MHTVRFGALPGVCEGAYGVRKTFYLDGVRLEVPDAVMDKSLRWMIDREASLEDAYGYIGWTDALPEAGMRECCYSVLKQKYMDANLEWQLSGWGYTCSAYHDCLEKYVLAMRETNKRGRMKIAPGVYSPSPVEESCIKQRFAIYRDVVRAYSECNVLDILPTFSGAVETLDRLLSLDMQSATKQSIYKMISVALNLASPDPKKHHAAAAEDDKKPNYWLYAAVGVGGILFLTR